MLYVVLLYFLGILVYGVNYLVLKVSTFIYRHLEGNPNQEWFTVRSGILTSSDTRWCNVISSCPLPK